MLHELLWGGLLLNLTDIARGPQWVKGQLQMSIYAPNGRNCSVECNGQNTPLIKSGQIFSGGVSNCNPGSQYQVHIDSLTRIDPLARDITPDGQKSVVPSDYTWSTSAVKIEKSRVVVYEMHISSFTSEGTFDAAIAKLDYVAQLGVTMLDVLPVFQFCGNAAGWGYNPCSPYAIKPELGGSLGLKKFVDAANKRGMGVMLDVVFNHFDQGNYLNNYDGSEIYLYTDNRRNTPWGPRPNYDSQYVREQFLVGNTQMFMDEFHITGFRWDATVCIRQGGGSGNCWDKGTPSIPNGWKFLQQANDLAHNGKYAGTFTVAEDNQNYLPITQPTSGGGAGFDGQWGYSFFYGAVEELVKGSSSSIDMQKVANLCVFDDGSDPNSVIFTENHDQASNQNPGRIPNRLQPGGHDGSASPATIKRTMLGMGLVLTCRGFPMLFFQQEFLEFRSFDFPDPPKMDWGQTTSVYVKQTTDMVNLRTNKNGKSPGLLGGDGSGGKTLMVSNDASNKVAVIHRWSKSGDAIVIHNWYDTYYASYVIKGLPADGRWYKQFDGDSSKYGYAGSCASQTYVDISGGQGSVCVPKSSIIILTQTQ